jgi:hypothetical protein
MINKLSNSTVSNILKKRSHDKRVLFFENVILNDIKKLFEQVMPNVSNIEKPKSWEEFEELLKQQTGLKELPPEFKKMAKRKWEEASKLEEKLKSGDADSESLMKEVEGKETAYTASTFFQQAGERVAELATDPETYKMLALGVLLTLAFPAAAPIIVIGGTALAASSAISQASEGDYGAAAVDATLGILPFGSKSVRGSFVPRSRTQISPRTRIQQPSKAPVETPENLTRPESLNFKPKELEPFVAPESKYNLSAEQMAELEPISQAFAGWKMNPWEAARNASEFIEPKRQGMPGTAVRADTPAGYRRISPFNLTKKEIARIEKFGNMAEKEALARARQKKLGKAVGGSVGERISDSDTPFMKAVIDRYTALNNARVPETAEAGEYLSLGGYQNPSFVRTTPKPKITLTPVIPQRPWAFGSLESYQEAVSKQLDRPLNKEELTYTEKVYNEDVKRRRIETQEREIKTDFDFSKLNSNKYEEKGPIRKAAEKMAATAATVSAAAESTPVYPEALTVKPPPPIVSRVNLPQVKQYEYIPQIPPRNITPESSTVYPKNFSTINVSSSPITIPVDATPPISTAPVDLSPTSNIRGVVATSLAGSRRTNQASASNLNTTGTPGVPAPIVDPSTKPSIKSPIKFPGFPFQPKPFTDDGGGAGSVGRLTNQDVGIALDRIIGQRSGAYRIR